MGAQLEAINVRMARAIEEMSGMRQRFRQEAEEDVVALALAIARRVLHRELTEAPDALLGLVKAALEKIEAREVHTVRIRPEDAPMVKQFLGKMGLDRKSTRLNSSHLGISYAAFCLKKFKAHLLAVVRSPSLRIARKSTRLTSSH